MLEVTMKFLITILATCLWTWGCHSQVLTSGYLIQPLSTSVIPSYHVDGSLNLIHDDVVHHIFDQKLDSRDIFYINGHLRNKRATSFSYKTPDSSRTEHFDTYVDPRSTDGHALNRYQGEVSWISPEGIRFSLDYSADGGGFHPQAHHLPDSPSHRSFFIIGSKP